MLCSVTWTDRNKVSFLLYGMTKSGPGAALLLRTLREQRLPELIEIARWKSKAMRIQRSASSAGSRV